MRVYPRLRLRRLPPPAAAPRTREGGKGSEAGEAVRGLEGFRRASQKGPDVSGEEVSESGESAGDSGVSFGVNRAQGHRPRAQAACGRRDLVGGEVVGAKEDGAPAEAGRDRAGDFTTLFAAAEAAGLAGTLADGGPFTVFAPTDAAFADVPAETLQALLADPDAPAEVLLYHVVPERVLARDLVEGALVTTAEGRPFGVTLEGGAKVNGANVRRGMSWPRWEDPVGLRRLSFARSRTRTASKAPEGPSSTSAGPKGRSQRNSGRPLRA